MNLFIYYRISDKGNILERLSNGNKKSCFVNAIKEFGPDNFHVIADNCEISTVDFIKTFTDQGITYEETSLGNSGSFIYMINKIISIHKPDDYVYLLEDDYLHLPNSKNILLEGLQIADYVTLFDHLDYYTLYKNGGTYFNHPNFQKTRLYITKSTHWRESISTTMTFACKAKTLKKDYKIWKYFCKNSSPKDFYAFCKITSQRNIFIMFFIIFKSTKLFLIMFGNFFRKKKKLISSVPGFSTHTPLSTLSPIIDWTKI